MLRLPDRFQRYRDAMAVATLCAVVLLTFLPLLWGQKAFFFGDLQLQSYPWWEYWSDELKGGKVPLWYPSILGGMPFSGNPQIGLLYPPNWLLAILPAVRAQMLLFGVHLGWSGAGFYAWMRRGRFGLSTVPALLAAFSWMLGGMFITKVQFPNMLAAIAWVPWVLWGAETWARQGTLRAATLWALAVGLQLLAGHAQMSLYTIDFALLYLIVVWRQEGEARISMWRLFGGTLGVFVLAMLLDGGQLLPTLELVRNAYRQQMPLQGAVRTTLPPIAVTNLFAPYLHGNPNVGTWTYLSGKNFWETACYVGVVPFLLALAAYRRREIPWFWTLGVVCSLLLAMGLKGGIYPLAYYAMPGVARFNDAARFLVIAGASLPVLTALGAQRVWNAGGRRVMLAALALTILDLAWFAHGVYPTRPTNAVWMPSRFGWTKDWLVEKRQSRVWSGSTYTRWEPLLPFNDYRIQTPLYSTFLGMSLMPNTPTHAGWLSADGYDPMMLESAFERGQTLSIALDARTLTGAYTRNLSEDSVRLITFWQKMPFVSAPGFQLLYRSPWTLQGKHLFAYRNTRALPRARWIDARGKVHGTLLLVNTPHLLDMQVPASARAVVLADTAAPGWYAFEGRRELPIQATRRYWRHVALPSRVATSAAPRRIRFVYAPETWRLGVFVSLCTMAMSIAVLVGHRTQAGKQKRPPQGGVAARVLESSGRAPSL